MTKATNNIPAAYVRVPLSRPRVRFFSLSLFFFFNCVALSSPATIRNAYAAPPSLVITRFIEKRRLLTRSLKRPVFIKSLNFICQSPRFINPPAHTANRQSCVLADSIVTPGRNIDSLQCPNGAPLPLPFPCFCTVGCAFLAWYWMIVFTERRPCSVFYACNWSKLWHQEICGVAVCALADIRASIVVSISFPSHLRSLPLFSIQHERKRR